MSPYRFSRPQYPSMHYYSINLNCCINNQEYLILTIKENCQMDNCGKFGKKLLLWNYVPFSLIMQIMLKGGDFVSFFGPRGHRFALKSCAWGRDFDRKNSGLGGDSNWSN